MRIDEFVGLQYKYRGRGPDGWDCWGLFREVFRAGTGLTLPGFDDAYDAVELSVRAGELPSGIALPWRPLDSSTRPVFYDAVLMIVRRRWHIGMVVSPTQMLHMPAHKSSVIEPLSRYTPVIREYLRHEALC